MYVEEAKSRLDRFPWDRKCDAILVSARGLPPEVDGEELQVRHLRQVAQRIIDHRTAHPLSDAEREEWLASLSG